MSEKKTTAKDLKSRLPSRQTELVLNGQKAPVERQKSLPFDIIDSPDIQGVYLERFVESAESLRIELRAVTPEWAAEKLEKCNTHNRKMSQRVIERIECSIDGGRWEVNGDTIGFDTEDKLVNGQQRLKAIADSGVTVPCIVVYGLSPRAFTTLDQHKRRGVSDILSIEGYGYTNVMASSLGWVHAYYCNRVTDFDARKIDNDQVLPLLSSHPGLKDSVAWERAHRVHNPTLTPAMTAFLHYILSRIDAEATETFLRSTLEGINVPEGSHVHLLRRRLSSLAAGTKGPREQVAMVALVIKTWNRMRAGEPAGSVLIWSSTEEFPKLRQE